MGLNGNIRLGFNSSSDLNLISNLFTNTLLAVYIRETEPENSANIQ